MNWFRVTSLLGPYMCCARFGFEDRLKVISLSSVVSLVGFGGVPCPVTEQEIGRIRFIVDSGLPIRPSAPLHAGQRVRICAGPLTKLEGIL
jgi:transcription antitermination factor NusG